jgi:hypothetical protein
MELRIESARTTRDIDLAVRSLPGSGGQWDDAAVRLLLQDLANADLGDGFEFLIGEPTMDLDAAPYGGSRFPVEASMGDRNFASFHVDVSAGDVLREPFEHLEGRDWLGFAGIAPSKVPAISREEQFAEKLHAYSLPREGRPNSRVKDLVDLLLLIESGTLDAERLRQCIEATFRRPRHSPRSVAARSPAPGLGRTVCGDGRQVRAEPAFGGCVLARRRVYLWPAPMTIRLVRSFAASN